MSESHHMREYLFVQFVGTSLMVNRMITLIVADYLKLITS